MPSLRIVAFAALLTCLAPLAIAQTAPAIEKQMSPQEFRAAGLDKLSPDELARLNAWLGRTISVETSKAAAASKRKVEDDNRGFFNFGSHQSITAHLQGQFDGFVRGRTYVLDNGQTWQQTDDATLEGVRLTAPKITITPAQIGSAWYLQVDGYNATAKVKRIK